MKLYKKNLKKLINSKVYHPNMEHDACGVGLVVSTEGKKSRKIVEYGIEALKAVWHRGAVDADGKTGDGAGIHVEISRDFFKEKIENYGRKYDGGEICVGMIFLPRNDYNAQEKCKTLIETELLNNNFYIYRWRQVPINTSVLGVKAELTRPEIVQVIFKSNDKKLKFKELERQLYVIRRTVEKKALNSRLKDFYICSFSSKSIIYKGMFLAETLSDFYPDLHDERFISRFAIFHQRYSTNTFPSWDLAQPFRALAHNGEINTLKGNINWMKVHEQEMNSELFKEMENLKPVINSGNSDSAALDNVFELLNRSGHPAPLAKLMLIPDAWSKKSKTLPKSHQQLFNFLNSVIEPWDGPAAIAATDNDWAIVANDRNGLRPLRYIVTNDKLLFAGSETGMVSLEENKIVSKGRLGPGQIIGIKLDKGKVYHNTEIKNYLAKEYKHFNNQIIDLDKKFYVKNEKRLFYGEELRKRQYVFGLSIEDLELILHPMVEDCKEATGSMGDDTPVAVLSDRYRPLNHYFRQNFSQVTNPPIDSLRENKVMSLKTRFGDMGNILDFNNLTEENIYVLDSPILSNSQFLKFKEYFDKSFTIIDCTFEKTSTLKKALDNIINLSEIAVREGIKQIILTDKNLNENKIPIPMLLAVGAINSYLIKMKLRAYVSLNIQTGEALDTHSYATLLGAGATTINPYLALDTIHQRYEKKLFGKLTIDECIKRYIQSVNNGLLKIMSKMGISVLSSYRGGGNFETVGLSRTIVSEFFPGITSKISGIGISGIEKKIREIHEQAFKENISVLPIGGIYKYRKNGETHQYQGNLIHMLQHAVTHKSFETYKKYAKAIYDLPPINLRDLIDFKAESKKTDIGFLNDKESDKYLRLGLKILEREIPEQFLDDGGHFELSPMYHSILLWDLLDLINLAKISGQPLLLNNLEGWSAIAVSALRWLDVMTHPDNEISFFNDATIGIAASPDEIKNYSLLLGLKTTYANEFYTPLHNTGYSRFRNSKYCLFFDHGAVGPSYLPGHAHADTLSFEMSIGCDRFFVNSGTSLYGLSNERHRQRGTEAHSTVFVDGADSSEVWGGFRVARRASITKCDVDILDDSVSISAQHDGYLRFNGGVIHNRTIRALENMISIEDNVSGSFKVACSVFHLHPDITIDIISSNELKLTSQSGDIVIFCTSSPVKIESTSYHPGFGISVSNKKIVIPKCQT